MKRFRIWWGVILSVALPVISAASVAAAPEVVPIRTSDGLTLAGDLYATGAKGAPAVVALHMYRSDRKAWLPVVKPLHDAGIDLLTIDLRGHGDSAIQGKVNLSERVAERDPELFQSMWRDAFAAMDFLIARGNDPRRIAFLGASVGCSVAIDAAVRRETVRGVLLMTPGLGYLGIPTSQHIRDYGARPMKILCSTFEAPHGTTAIKEAVGPTCSVYLFEERNSHGTQMFKTRKGVEERIANWFRTILAGGVALDGEFSEAEGKGPGLHGEFTVEGGTLKASATRRGSYLHAVLTGRPELLPKRFVVAYAGKKMLAEAVALTVYPDRVATRHLLLRDGVFVPVRERRAPHRARPGAVRGVVLELLIPMSLIDTGFDPREGFRLAFAIGTADLTEKLTWSGQAKPDDTRTWSAFPKR